MNRIHPMNRILPTTLAMLALASSGMASPDVLAPVSKEAALRLAEPRVHVSADGSSLNYRLYVPKDLKDGEKVPLVLYFHGAAARGSGNKGQVEIQFFRSLLGWQFTGGEKAILLAPQCPTNGCWAPVAAIRRNRMNPATSFGEKPLEPLGLALEILDAALESLPVDRSRVYVCGNSMGGLATQGALLWRPGVFAAAIPVCSCPDPARVADLDDVPVWIVHGGADHVVGARGSRDLYAALRALPGRRSEVRYTEVPGAGHDVWAQAFCHRDFFDWMFAQRREPGKAIR